MKTNRYYFFFPFSETIMFLHQIFYQGLKARIASWPTLVLGKKCFSLPFYDFSPHATIEASV